MILGSIIPNMGDVSGMIFAGTIVLSGIIAASSTWIVRSIEGLKKSQAVDNQEI
jgi:hypothetical protein